MRPRSTRKTDKPATKHPIILADVVGLGQRLERRVNCARRAATEMGMARVCRMHAVSVGAGGSALGSLPISSG